jgi:hypothetical protein
MPWVKQFNMPTFGGLVCEPQGICFLDETTLLITAHRDDAVAILFKTTTTGTVLASCSSTAYRHPGTVRVGPGGEIWMQDFFATGSGGPGFTNGIVDIDACFASGVLVIDPWDLNQDVQPVAGIDFVTFEGTDYVFLNEFSSSQNPLPDGSPWLWIYLQSQLNTTVAAADRFRRINIGLRNQDVAVCNGRLYVSSNSSSGIVKAYRLSDIFATPDGETPAPVQTVTAAGSFGEGLTFRPSDNQCWMLTEFSGRGVWAQDIVPITPDPEDPGPEPPMLQFLAGWRF